MNIKPEIAYNVDKLNLIFKTLPGFEFPDSYSYELLTNGGIIQNEEIKIWDCNPIIPISIVFIFQQGISMEGNFRKKNPNMDLYCICCGNKYYVGSIKTYLEGALRIEIDNRFLYTNYLQYLPLLEDALKINLHRIANLDICADANQNLPRKLNDNLHSSQCKVTRPGRTSSNSATKKGNMVLGLKVSKNIKTLTSYEYKEPTYIYNLYKGSPKDIELVGYNKTTEIEEEGLKKKYILEAYPFSNEKVYRLELRLRSQYLTEQSKKAEPLEQDKKGWSLEYIFKHLQDESFLKEFFIVVVNKFYRLKIKNKDIKISELLRLE